MLNNLHKPWRHLKILGARTVIWIKLHSDDPRILGVIVQKFSRHDDLATWTFAPLPYTKHFFSLVLSEYILLTLFFLWIFWDGSVYKLSWLLPGKTQETHEEFQNSRFLVERFEIRTQVRNILFTTIHWSYVPRSSQLAAGIARLTLWFIMSGHGRIRPWLLLRYRLCSPVTAQNLSSYSGKSFLRNYSRWGCDTTQSGRNLPTHFIYLRRSIVSVDPVLRSSHRVAVRWLADVLEKLASL